MASKVSRKCSTLISVFAGVIGVAFSGSSNAQPQRAFGADVSYWNCGTAPVGMAQTNWNIARTNGNVQFVWLRATRGGTTGVDQGAGTPGGGTQSTLSRRYDDPRFVQNINRATAAGMIAGSYHFARPDISGNTGADEANHMMQMAGAWMRPGYLLPVFDLEAGEEQRTDDELAQWCLDFSDRMFSVMSIRPGMYINGRYSVALQNASQSRQHQLARPVFETPTMFGPAFSFLWIARYDTNANIQTSHPKDSFSGFYGPWDDYGVTHPWDFWQFYSQFSIPGFNTVDKDMDANVSQGDFEYVLNYLVPALWRHDNSGDWNTLANWNSGVEPIAPATPPDQAQPYSVGPLPTPRLPGAAGEGPTSGKFDTVILERLNANVVINLTSGTHNVRKLYNRETLNISGGSLTINYDPSYRADDSPNVRHGGSLSAQFSGPVNLSGGELSVHTLQVDATQTFGFSGGALTLAKIDLMPHADNPGRILITGNVTLNSRSNVTARIVRGAGSGSTGGLDFGGLVRTLTINDGTNDVDVSVDVPIRNGGFVKAGAGTLRLTGINSYLGGTVVSAGTLLVNNTIGSGTGTAGVTVNNGTLGGTGTIAGVVTVASGGTMAPGTSTTIGTLTLNSAPVLNGTTAVRVSGSSQCDRLALTSGTMVCGGDLIVSQVGAPLIGGQSFKILSAPAFAGQFANVVLPPLGAGLNWVTNDLYTTGTIKINRQPVAPVLSFATLVSTVLEIPFAALTAGASDPDGNPLTLVSVTLTTTNGTTLQTNATSMFYSYSTPILDQFTYTVSDNLGGIATGVVNIYNVEVGPSAQFSGSPVFAGNWVNLTLQGAPGWTYYTDRSTNLVLWTTIATNVAPWEGGFTVTDRFPEFIVRPPAAFYRLRW